MTDARRDRIHAMADKAVEMLRLARDGFRKQDTGPLEAAGKLGGEIHEMEKVLTGLVAGGPAEADRELSLVPLHLERVGDNVELLVRAIRTMVEEGVPFTERALREISTLFASAIELLECVRDLIPTGNRVLIRHVLEEGARFEATANDYALAHQQRLVEGVCMAKASSLYVALLDDLKGVEWHTRQIAAKLAAAPSS